MYMYVQPYKHLLKIQHGLIEHTKSCTIHTYILILTCIYVKKILNQLPSVGLCQARHN